MSDEIAELKITEPHGNKWKITFIAHGPGPDQLYSWTRRHIILKVGSVQFQSKYSQQYFMETDRYCKIYMKMRKT